MFRYRDEYAPAVALLGVGLALLLLQLLAFAFHKLTAAGQKRKLCGPWQIWVDCVLTACPLATLTFGILLPVGFSYAGLSASNFWVDVNLDFSTYLAAELDDQYLLDLTLAVARDQITRSDKIHERGGDRWRSWNFAEALQNLSNGSAAVPDRRLVQRTQSVTYWRLDLFYEAKDSEKGIFTPEALEEIRDFESRIRATEGFETYCRKRFGVDCDPAYSVTNVFFAVPNATTSDGETMQVIYDGSGGLANINDVLRGFLRDGVAWWVDKDFGPRNVRSQYTRATFFGGVPLPGYPDIETRLDEQLEKSNQFLVKLWETLLHRTDISGPDALKYEHVTFTWVESRALYNHEVVFYLISDCLFCAGTFLVVSILVLLRQQNIFISFFGVLGVLLAFTSTYYFHYAVMGYKRLTLLDFISLFLIASIAADDILLLYNTYQLAPALHRKEMKPAEKMRWAYREASAAMLVTSATTCGSFYANLLSIVTVVRAFGFFMGTLVVWNFLNVLTIFPSALLVNDMYLIPCLRYLCCCCCRGTGAQTIDTGAETPRPNGVLQAASRLARQFSKDHGSHSAISLEIQAEVQHERLDCMERMVAKYFTPFVAKCRWLLLALSLGISATFITLAITGFELASGDIVIFEKDVNLGRVEKLQTELFSSYNMQDLNFALSVTSPLSPTTVPSCPRLGDNNSWCSGSRGSCDTFTGQCTCQGSYVGQGCSVPLAAGTLDVVSLPWPQQERRFEAIHILARPSMLRSPASVEASLLVLLQNNGDNNVEWSVSATAVWLGLLPTSGVVEKRSFSRADYVFPGVGGFEASYFLGGQFAGFSEEATATISSVTPGIDDQQVIFSASVLQPPALSLLDVLVAETVEEVNVTPMLEPAFALDYGFSDDDSLNLAAPGKRPQPSYNVSVPFGVRAIAVRHVAYGTAAAVAVEGVSSNGTSQAIALDIEPAINVISITVSSALSYVSVIYHLEVVRESTTTTTTLPPNLIVGEVSIDVSNCSFLSTDEAAQGDLAGGLAAAAEVPAGAVTVDVRCSRRLSEERQLQSGGNVVYEMLLPGDLDLVATLQRLEEQSPSSLTQRLQESLANGTSGLVITVTAISPLQVNPTTTTLEPNATTTATTITTTSESTTTTTRTSTSSSSTSMSSSSSTATSTSATSTSETSTTVTGTVTTTTITSTSSSSTSSSSTSSSSTSRSSTSSSSTSSSSTRSTRTTSTATVDPAFSTTATTSTRSTYTSTSASSTTTATTATMTSSTATTFTLTTTSITETTSTWSTTTITSSTSTQTTSSSTSTSSTSNSSTSTSSTSTSSTSTSSTSTSSTTSSSSSTSGTSTSSSSTSSSSTSSTSSTATVTSTSTTSSSATLTISSTTTQSTSITMTRTTNTITTTNGPGTETTTTSQTRTSSTITTKTTTTTSQTTTSSSTTTKTTTTKTATSTTSTSTTTRTKTTTSTTSSSTTTTTTLTVSQTQTSTSSTTSSSSTSTRSTQTSTSGTSTLQSTSSSRTFTSSSTLTSSGTSVTGTTTSLTGTTSSSTITSTTTLLDYVFSGSLSLETSNCTALETPEGQQGLEKGIAEVAVVDPSYVDVTDVACSRRLALDDSRRLSEVVVVGYIIDLPPTTTDAAIVLGIAAQSNLQSESLQSLGQTLELALVSAGVPLSLNVTQLGDFALAEKTTTTSTTTTTLYCPGEPVCGGIQGDCVVAPPGDPRHWVCQCQETYDGENCSERICPSCQNNGTCDEGLWGCNCTAEFQGERCELLRCPKDCSEAGDCDTYTGRCECYSGYAGEDCSEEPTQLVPITNCIEIMLTWGLKGYEVDNTSAAVFEQAFDLFAPEAQAWLLETCAEARVREDLMVREQLVCWIEGWERYLRSVDGEFPVENPDLASQGLQAFMHLEAAAPFLGDVATDQPDYDGRPYFARVRLKINVAMNDATSYRTEVQERWADWVEARNARAPASAGAMLMVSVTFTQMELESQVLASTFMAFGGSITVSMVAVAIFTQNLILALYVCLNVILVVCVLSGFLLNIMDYEFGVAEAIGATIFVGLSLDYCLHLAHAYNEAPMSESLEKMRHALVVIGPSIMGGAITTISGTAFLLPCRILLFQKLGWTLFANAIVSMVYTFMFLSPVLIICGPTGSMGTIFCLPCFRRCTPHDHVARYGESRVQDADVATSSSTLPDPTALPAIEEEPENALRVQANESQDVIDVDEVAKIEVTSFDG
ncbi:unnamed protein product [Effrenium voratum]|uniref:Uncharacterized protein n=1 Tax=Effrenium voratum TaxID=2562239 RepID=A0AA36HXD1_9DINO|nr:unnamed protein product [Effrenium voratum]